MTDVEAARAAMASMLIAALEEAERERDLSVAREPTSAELAAAAWSKLQYDFPVVSPAELDALAKEMEAEAGGGGTGPPSAGAALAYGPTNSLVAAVIEGASRAPADAAADDASASALRRAFQRLCAVVLVRAPARLARGDALARADAFLSGYRSAATFRYDGETEVCRAMDDTIYRDADADTCARRQSSSDADADADADADWEPLEANGSVPRDAAAPRFARDGSEACSEHVETTTGVKTRVHRKLRDLLERARYAYFDAEDASDVASSSGAEDAWTLRGVGNAAAELVELFYSDDGPSDGPSAAAACGGYALRLLRERWRVAGVAADGADALRRSLRALGLLDENASSCRGDRRARVETLGVETLGVLCAPFVLFTSGLGSRSASRGVTGRHAEEEARARALWPVAAEALAPVARALDEALADFKNADFNDAKRNRETKREETERLETHIAACCAVIAFYAARAPGNASVGTELLKSGALRAAAATFCAISEIDNETRDDAKLREEETDGAETSLASEAARRCLLLASAASPDAAAFALAVPGVRRAIETSDAFLQTAHGALWALVSRGVFKKEKGDARSAETGEKACAERFAASARDDPVVAVDALGLLRLVQLASRLRGRNAPALFSDRPDAPLRLVLREAADAHAAAVAAAAAARAAAARAAAAASGSAATAARKPSSSDDESDSDDAHRAPPSHPPPARLGVDDETEKRAAAASAALRLIKEIVDGFRGGAGARKCD